MLPQWTRAGDGEKFMNRYTESGEHSDERQEAAGRLDAAVGELPLHGQSCGRRVAHARFLTKGA